MKEKEKSIDGIAPRYKFAGAFIRLLALLVDITILIPIIAGLMFLLFMFLKIYVLKSIIINLFIFIFMSYFIVLPATEWQATLGMKALCLRIINLNGKKISIWKSLVRTFFIQSPYLILSVLVYLFNITELICILGVVPFIFIIFDKYKRGFYDIICGTYVIKR
jgi:uncharacterized RDD family membrane protein YckC